MCEKSENAVPSMFGGMIDRSRAVAYCYYHHAHLTEKQLKKKRCLGKGCSALKKMEHPYWEQRERRDLLKKLKREAGIPVWKKVAVKTNHDGEVIGIADKR